MNRLRTTLLPILFAAAILAAGSLGQQAVAQQGHEEHDPFQGVTIEALSSIAPPQLPGYTLVLMRITLEPGAEIPAHGHPGAVALTIDSAPVVLLISALLAADQDGFHFQ